jgi:hypothetical protein
MNVPGLDVSLDLEIQERKLVIVVSTGSAGEDGDMQKSAVVGLVSLESLTNYYASRNKDAGDDEITELLLREVERRYLQ